MTMTLGAHTLCFSGFYLGLGFNLGLVTIGPGAVLGVDSSIAALHYYCTISYLRMVERCTIKSTHISM